MPDEAFIEKQRAQVGVAAEPDPVHVMALALHETRRAVEADQRIDGGVGFRYPRLHPDANAVTRSVEVIDDFETQRIARPIDRGHVQQEIEAELGLEAPPDSEQLRRRDLEDQHVVRDRRVPIRQRKLRLHHVVVHGGQDQNVRVMIGWRACAIWSCSFMIASMTVSGRGGQPGT